MSIFDSVKADVKVKAKLQSVSDDSVLVSKMDNVSPGNVTSIYDFCIACMLDDFRGDVRIS